MFQYIYSGGQKLNARATENWRAGQAVVLNSLVAICPFDIPTGEPVGLQLNGVFWGDAVASESWEIGDALYLIVGTNGTLTKSGNGNPFFGYAESAKIAGDEKGRAILVQQSHAYSEMDTWLGPISETTVIEAGDLLYYDTGTPRVIKRASMQPNQSSKSGNQSLFAGKFLGVAMQDSPLGVAGEILIATRGVFDFACNAATFDIGDFIGLEEIPGRMGIENQKVSTAVVAGAFGKVIKVEPVETETVRVYIKSRILFGAVS